MEKLFNPQYRRWEVIPDNPLVRNGEEVAVYVSEDPEACDAYIRRCDKKSQYKTVLTLIENNGYVDRWMAACNGVMELSSRIGEMKREGILIKDRTVKRYDKDGKYAGRHKEYFI